VSAPIRKRYGRLLSDFEVGQTYEHPWEVTIDGGMIALFQASFLDAMPLYASRTLAKSYGFEDRPLHPLLCLNLGLSFSVHDVSEQAIAHLAYLDVRFPKPGYSGDTVRARSTVLGVKPGSAGDRGVVHVRTVLVNDRGAVLCAFERKALVRTGRLESRHTPHFGVNGSRSSSERAVFERLPQPLARNLRSDVRSGFLGLLEEFEPGQIFVHEVGKTIGESEHMQLTALMRNSHPLHFDEVYSQEHSFQKTRVVYGGLVLAWVLSLTSRDLAGNALWDLGLDDGAHPSAVLAGDTLYALSKVLAVRDRGTGAGEVTLRIVGVKNKSAAQAFDEYGEALFENELAKKERKIKDKVVEITRTLYIRRAS
jgi:2-methylfumaryl-CoA hydratase